MDFLKERTVDHQELQNPEYRPIFFNLSNSEEQKKLKELIEKRPEIKIYDEIDGQLRELIKISNPTRKIKDHEYPDLIEKHLNGADIYKYGNWVYYPWSQKVLHILGEEEFVEVRTNRNRYKLTKEEQEFLRKKVIGIIGLSVGQSIALTIATERICGELRLADFDTVELSNLNRIRTGIQNLGLRKTIIAAREIYEIDPYLNVVIYNDGFTSQNSESFFANEGKVLDLLIEVCDGLDVKIHSRFKARDLKIPVLMDTNDRGMLDVERFDLEPERPIMHGLAGDLDPEKIKDLTNEEKIPYILKMVGADTISTRLKASMMEVEQSINTWPQLASSVVLGGALTTDTARRVLLDQYHESGRFYIDFDELIKDSEEKDNKIVSVAKNPHAPMQETDVVSIANKYLKGNSSITTVRLNDDQLEEIKKAAHAAPSAGNNQPWKWYYKDGVLLLLHDKYRSWSWGDYDEMGAHMGLGTAIENVHLAAVSQGLNTNVTIFPIENEPRLIASIIFEPSSKEVDSVNQVLVDNLYNRCTNRKLGERVKLPLEFYNKMQYLVNASDSVKLFYTDSDKELDELGRIMAACDRIRMLHPQGHEEFYSEVRWSSDDAQRTRDGIELSAVDLTEGERAGFYVAQDYRAVSLLSKWNKGNAFRRYSEKAMKSSAGVLMFAIDEFSHEKLIEAGRIIQRCWIYANSENVSVHPMLSPVFFFSRLIIGKEQGLPEPAKQELKQLRKSFIEIFPIVNKDKREYSEVFLMKLAIADDMGVKSLRKPVNEIFYID